MKTIAPGIRDLATYPGRCPACYFHVETQGHRPTCQKVASVRAEARAATEAATPDPEWKLFVEAITADAAAHGGLVSANRIRDAIGARWVTKNAKRRYSGLWARARRVGLLVDDTDEREQSTDKAGGNSHNEIKLLRLTSAAERRAA